LISSETKSREEEMREALHKGGTRKMRSIRDRVRNKNRKPFSR
jgi:hypothetical protein